MQGKASPRLQAELAALLTPLRRYCHSLTGNAYDADDLLHDTVERLLTRGAPVDADTLRWALRVCRNRWVDEVRSRRVRAAGNIDDMPDAVAVDGEMEGRMALVDAEAAIARLPQEFREVLMLVTVEGMKYREAADLIGVPVGTVMSRLARARKALVEYEATGPGSHQESETNNVVQFDRSKR
ncbi:sigma-70 family RNA polymerase sigma factor [Qipengyuania sp. 1XM1-15A]|uniref:sigma-70 family RNA polymerase sigma factor n=1 Tax=Qipengyuania xiamenensis TaxID=2867237 RepID=UPI001C867094|nr:sigma-70 family RNA polymerase sigma factor [Qipengyuania xiamenensis]MBX7532041.1 sigma-70 family RNA polymerase sigma factor [Qipengyuania xiamenensis]